MATEEGVDNRLRILFALRAVPLKMISDVLADGTIISRFDLKATQPVKLAVDTVVPREGLFNAFRTATEQTSATLSVTRGASVVEGTVQIEADGSGVLILPDHRWRFAHAGLMARDSTRRRNFLEGALKVHTLTIGNSRQLRGVVAREPFSHDDFVEATSTLASSPESFVRELREQLAKGSLTERDFLPGDVRYWENLTAARASSESLTAFLSSELSEERRARITANPLRAIEGIALTFAAPELVPYDLLDELQSDTLIRAIDLITGVNDHFGLAGAFEICASRSASDPRFIELGDRALERLIGDVEQLRIRCTAFATAFILSSARLAVHSATRNQPVFWRRLSAAAHASLVVRSCETSNVDRKGLLSWAIHLRGREFLLSAYRDMAPEPRWRPEWLDSGILAADAFGRVSGAIVRFRAEDTPKSWIDRIAAAKKWIEDNQLGLPMHFPSVLQGAATPPVPDSDLKRHIEDTVRAVVDEPTIENLCRLPLFIEVLSVPAGATAGAHKVLIEIQKGAAGLDDESIQIALKVAARIAVLASDVSLADAVAVTCLAKAQSIKRAEIVMDIVLRLAECAAADGDPSKARETLASRLEQLSFLIPAAPFAADLVALLEALQRVDPELAPLLGRAVSAARLAIHATADL